MNNKRQLLGELLREVSRSFYLTLRVLPGSIRDQIGTAYLLARATDTIADTGAISVARRLEALKALGERIIAGAGAGQSLAFGGFAVGQSSPAERVLLERINEVLALVEKFEPGDQQEIRRVLQTITSGQELDLLRFSARDGEKRIVALETGAELDDYTYRVAGCVGEFWTRICVRHLTPKPAIGTEELAGQGIRFGKGLQLVNILRDLPVDLRNGRCYLPASQLSEIGLEPGDLLLSRNEPRVRPVYDQWVRLAEEHLNFGWQYVLSLPGSWIRLRLACAWPILIGVQTLDRLKRENVLDPATRIKISRAEVKRIIRNSVLSLPFKKRWERLPAKFRADVNQVAR